MKLKLWLILAATILASGMSFLIGTAISIALPAIQQQFNASVNGIQWVVSAQILTLASFMLVSGLLSDRYGRKKLFLAGIALFTIASLFSGFSKTIIQLILLQGVQGIGAAMMIPGSLAIINICFPKNQRGKAIGLWSGLSGGIAVLGPLVGGLLIDTWNWPSVFFFIVPFGIITFFLALLYVPESKNEKAESIDWIGAILISASLLATAFALIQGPTVGWDNNVLILFLGIALFILFVIHQRSHHQPMIPAKMLTKKVVGANLATFLLYFALQGLIFFLVLNFQQFQNYSATAAGLGLLPAILIITFLSGPAGALTDKIGARTPLIMGPLIVAVGMASMILPGVGTSYFTGFLPGLILFGVGMALVIPSITKTALAVPEQFSGIASGLNNAVSRVSFVMAIALLGAVVFSLFTVQLDGALQDTDLTAEQQTSILEQSSKFGEIDTLNLEPAKEAVNTAFLFTFRLAMGIVSLLAVLTAVIAYKMVS